MSFPMSARGFFVSKDLFEGLIFGVAHIRRGLYSGGLVFGGIYIRRGL